MFAKLTSAGEILTFTLGSALTMERTALEMLEDLEKEARRDDVKRIFREHLRETRVHVSRIERAFELLGEEIEDQPSAAMDGLQKQSRAIVKKTDDRVVDAVLLAGATQIEYHEIAVYETLTMNARASSASQVDELLAQTLGEERAALEKIQTTARRLSQEGIGVSG